MNLLLRDVGIFLRN